MLFSWKNHAERWEILLRWTQHQASHAKQCAGCVCVCTRVHVDWKSALLSSLHHNPGCKRHLYWLGRSCWKSLQRPLCLHDFLHFLKIMRSSRCKFQPIQFLGHIPSCASIGRIHCKQMVIFLLICTSIYVHVRFSSSGKDCWTEISLKQYTCHSSSFQWYISSFFSPTFCFCKFWSGNKTNQCWFIYWKQALWSNLGNGVWIPEFIYFPLQLMWLVCYSGPECWCKESRRGDLLLPRGIYHL